MKFILFILLLASLSGGEQEWIVRMQSLATLNDPMLASIVADNALKEYPDNPLVMEWAVRAYAHAGNEEKMYLTYKAYADQNKELNRDLIEEMAWGVIEKGAKSQAPMTRVIALVAGAIANDARGCALLVKGHDDPNRIVRLLAAEFSGHFRDSCLQETVWRRMRAEKDFAVRQALIKACGGMKLRAAEAFLVQVLENDRTRAEERAAALSSLAALKETVGRNQVEALALSERAGLRMLASELIAFNDRKEDIDLLNRLLLDSHPEVRMQALETAALLRSPETDQKALQVLVKDKNPGIALRAARVITLQNPNEGQQWFVPYLKSENREEQLFAAAVLRMCGKYGYPLNVRTFRESRDPYVRLILAEALLEQRVEPEQAAGAIRQFLTSNPERMTKVSSGGIEWIAPYELDDGGVLPEMREAVNQIIRLELINSLAIEGDPEAISAMKQFLKERTWGISGAAASLLLHEGDPESIELIKSLLNDPQDKVKLQAALVMGMWGGSPEAIDTLEALYPKASRDQKGQILEALGRIGDSKSFPFLIERMNEPQQVLRMIAAAAILQTLYH